MFLSPAFIIHTQVHEDEYDLAAEVYMSPNPSTHAH